MAKLWEVLKAFDEGKAFKAKSYDLLMVQEKEGIVFYNNDGKTDEQNINSDDLNVEWTVVENLEQKTFEFLYVIYDISGHERGKLMKSYDYQHLTQTYGSLSLLDAKKLIQTAYPGDQARILSAVGVSESGETTILVQEGKMTE